jgi:hypothetical protein
MHLWWVRQQETLDRHDPAMAQEERADEARASRALAWIVGQLEAHSTPYQVVGGLAVRAWGGSRDVQDIDLYIPFDRGRTALSAMARYITWGPEHYQSDCWDLTFLKLDFGGQRIELGDSSSTPRFFDVIKGVWEDQRIAFQSSVRLTVFGTACNVIPKQELIRYKRALDRPVDRIDVADLLST